MSGGRQSVVSGSAAGGGASGSAASGQGKGAAAGELPTAVEFEPPFACVRRILKTALPASTNVGKDASAAFARASGACVPSRSAFVSVCRFPRSSVAVGFRASHHPPSCAFLQSVVAGIFIIYLTACANDFARENKRQTITANDVLAAVKVRAHEKTNEGRRRRQLGPV
jgi:histone H3/H4